MPTRKMRVANVMTHDPAWLSVPVSSALLRPLYDAAAVGTDDEVPVNVPMDNSLTVFFVSAADKAFFVPGDELVVTITKPTP